LVNKITGVVLGQTTLSSTLIGFDGGWNHSFSQILTQLAAECATTEFTDLEIQYDIGDGINYANHKFVRPFAGNVDLGAIEVGIITPADYVNLQGVVRDQFNVGAPVSGARVYLMKGEGWGAGTLRGATNTSTSRALTSDGAGLISAAGLEPGIYTVLVVKTGYQDLRRPSVNIAGTGTLELSLQPAPFSGPTQPLNDTGITPNQCYRAGTNTFVSCTSPEAIALNAQQDGMVGRDVTDPDHIDGKLGFSYSLVPKPGGGFYDKTECVKDNVTGLMWEGKTADGGPRDRNRRYINWGDDRPGDASAYAASVNATGLCGHSSWRLPNRHELEGLIDYGATWPVAAAIDTNWFPHTTTNAYWSSSPMAGYPGGAWIVHFNLGYVQGRDRNNAEPVRLVR